MRTVWSALVVLVLLVPFGGVGITATPLDAEIVAAPRGPAGAVAKRMDCELPPVLAVVAEVAAPMRVVVPHALVHSLSTPIVTDRHPPAGPRDPPA